MRRMRNGSVEPYSPPYGSGLMLRVAASYVPHLVHGAPALAGAVHRKCAILNWETERRSRSHSALCAARLRKPAFDSCFDQTVAPKALLLKQVYVSQTAEDVACATTDGPADT